MSTVPPRARVIFMGTPDFAVPCIGALHAHRRVELLLVVCQPDKVHGRHSEPQAPPTKVAAQRLGVPVAQPTKLRSGDFPELLRELAPDLVVVTAYGRILPDALLALPRLGCVNVHASLLPRWRGAGPIQWAVAAGDAESGVCLMQMDSGLDTGPVLRRAAIPLRPDETGATLHDRLSALGSAVLAESLDALLDGDLRPTPQDASAATLAPILTRAHGQLDFALPAVELERRIRAFHPWPGAFSHIFGNDGRALVVKLFPGVSIVARPAGEPGEIVLDGDAWIVPCGEGALRVSEVQLEGKRRMAVAELVRGFRLPPGARLVGV